MTEENKQEQQEEAAVEKTSQEAAVKAPKEEAKDKTPQRVEIPKNCGACKKPVAKMRYYRNMQFFCNKKCWKTFKDKEVKDKEEAKQKAATQ
ncbi:MAG: hypothetical protein V1739_02625 [Candidatus Omnitrophota bacterium]